MKVCLFFAININDMTKSKVDWVRKNRVLFYSLQILDLSLYWYSIYETKYFSLLNMFI